MTVCQQCGACCAAFRVSFYWAEAPQRELPAELVEKVSPHLACMVGTNQSEPRCRALSGEVGQQVECVVYPSRPSPCREVTSGDERCNTARARHGLPAITLHDI
jgi:Fe-S-cluster containining protein